MMKLSYQNLLYFLLGLITLIILFKLYFKNTPINEGFLSVIKKLKKGKNKSVKRSKGKLTFEDVMKEAEEIDHEKYTINNLKSNFFDYVDSFKKEDFKNVTGTTNEALDKFKIFKDKFFEIFI